MVIFTDLHIHNYQKFSNNSSRLNNCLDVLSEMFKIANKNNLPILFVGDLFDKQVLLPVEVINKTIEHFADLFDKFPNTKFYAISGNHDQASKNTIAKPAITALSSLDRVFENFILIDNETVKINNYVVHGIPYYEYIEDFYEKLSNVKADILLIHQAPNGISDKYIHTNMDISFAKNFKLVLCGHIHKAEKLKDNFIVLGSPLHKDLSDEGQIKGYYIFDDYNMTFYPLDYPMFSSEEGKGDYYIPRIEKLIAKDEVDIDFSAGTSKLELLESYLKHEKRLDLLELAQQCVE